MRSYSDEQKAAVYATLQLNNDNVLRTARETGVPRPTIQTWRREWNSKGVPEEIMELATREAEDFVTTAEHVRDSALTKLKELVPQAQLKDMKTLVVTVGVLDDKVRLAKGLATSRAEKQISLPSPEDMKELLRGMVVGAMDAQSVRNDDIIDAEIVEHHDMETSRKALPMEASK